MTSVVYVYYLYRYMYNYTCTYQLYIYPQYNICNLYVWNICTCIVFLHQKKGETAVQELLSNCNRYKKELKLEDDVIESAVNDYKVIQKKAGETGCTVSCDNTIF